MQRRALSITVAALVSLSAVQALAADSGSGSKRKTTSPTSRELRVKELRELVGEASAQEAALLDEIAVIQDRLDALNAEVKRLSREVSTTERRLAAAEKEINQSRAAEIDAVYRLVEAESGVAAARMAMNATVTALYQRGQDREQAAYATIVSSAASPHEVFTAAHYLEGTFRHQRADLDTFSARKAEVESLRTEAERRSAEAKLARDELTIERDRLATLKAEAVTARAGAKAEEERQQELLDEVKARKDDFQRELAVLQADSNAIGQLLRELQAGQKMAPRRKGTFRYPVKAPISSHYGPRSHPIFGDSRPHTGTDFAAGTGTPIAASGPGIVAYAGPRAGYGNLVAIDHGNGLATLYAHQSNIESALGQRVKTGDIIGYVGSTGYSTGPHLHFEVREKGTPVDPRLYLP